MISLCDQKFQSFSAFYFDAENINVSFQDAIYAAVKSHNTTEIARADLVLGEELGKGAFGVVQKVRNTNDSFS
jgi:hypothetical protein